MKLNGKFAVAASTVLALVAALGCGGKKLPDGMPRPQPTTITLTLDGKGLADANVSLIPADGSSRWTALGQTNGSGVAEMKVDGQYKGAVPGEYKVVISAKDEVDYGEFGPPPKDDPVALEKWSFDVEQSGGVAQFKRYSLVATEFTDAETTPLTLTVKEGKNAETFDLGASTREEVEVEVK